MTRTKIAGTRAARQPPAWSSRLPTVVSVKWVGVVLGLVGGLGTAGWLVLAPESPEVDPVLAAKVLPVIDEELERGPWPVSRPGARWFCAERVIEIRRTGDELVVGIDALCEEFARDGDALVAVSGEHGPKVVVLASDSAGYRVVRVAAPPDGAGFAPWVARSFSAAGTDELDQPFPDGDLPAVRARQAFGLPADAPVRPS